MRLRLMYESRVFQISDEVNNIFRRLAASFNQRRSSQELVNLGGRKVLVTVADISDNGKRRWNYEHNVPEIIISSKIVGKPVDIIDTLVHEYTHIIDPGAPFRSEAGQSGDAYWGHASEFNALSNEIIHNIIRHLIDIRDGDPGALQLYLDKLYTLLKYPKYAVDWVPFSEKIVEWWEDNPKLWRTFKVRLYNAIQDVMNRPSEREEMLNDLMQDYEFTRDHLLDDPDDAPEGFDYFTTDFSPEEIEIQKLTDDINELF